MCYRCLLRAFMLLVLAETAAAWFGPFATKEEDPEKHEKALLKMDLDGDGLVSLEELIAEDNWNDPTDEIVPQLKEMFPKGDSDGDGKLTTKELELLFQHYHAASEAKRAAKNEL
mmetsp:Transcript_28435/g.51386  ORF Transcript_28435/g.51386 Transcript_28435/m.51386 type:complete len:115 (+) Transcript_28435:38-382(+)